MISFIISTDGAHPNRIERIIDSIDNNNIPTREIIVVGGEDVHARAVHLPFDESDRPMWITRKKNLATQKASQDVIVYLHDYHEFHSSWYIAMEHFGWDWDVQMNSIATHEGKRFMDWLIFDHPDIPRYSYLPYDRSDLVKHQYISGGYWVAKREFMLRNPLDESRCWNQMEDVEWSMRIRETAKVVMNPRALVRHLKPHRDSHLFFERAKHFSVDTDLIL